MKFKLTKIKEGYIAQGYGEFKPIIVQEKTKKAIKKAITQCLMGYLEAFPDTIKFVEDKKK